MIKALLFDLFGTVVDWRTSIIGQAKLINFSKNIKIDWEEFVINWRLKYQPIMEKVNKKIIPWRTLDELHEITLNEVCKEMNIRCLKETDKKKLILLWHKLDPCSDSCEAINELSKEYITASLSNGNILLQKNLIKNAKLNFDFIFSAEHFKKYKPEKIVYLGAANFLNLSPKDCALVASHKSDLLAASKLGLKTIFIFRANEFGRYKNKFREVRFNADINVNSLLEISDEIKKKFKL